MRRILFLVGGGLLLLAGLVLLVLPGPGIPLLAIGAMMVASEVPAVRRWISQFVEKLPISDERKKKICCFLDGKAKHAH